MKETALLQQTVDAVSGVEAAGSGARAEVVEELLRRKLRPDPRLVLLAMVVCNIAVMSQVDLRLVAICSVLTALALITARAWKTVIAMLAIEAMWAFFLGLAPGLWPNVVTGFLAMVGLWLIRFTVSAALAGYFIIAVVPGELWPRCAASTSPLPSRFPSPFCCASYRWWLPSTARCAKP